MIAKVFFAAVSIALVYGAPKPEAAIITAPQVAYAAAPVVLTKPVATPVTARFAVAPVATSTSSQYFTRTYNGVTYAVAAPVAVAPVVDTRARFVAAAPQSQVVVAPAPQVLVGPAQFVSTPTATSAQVFARTYNGLPAVTYYSVPTFAAAPVAVGVATAPVAAPVPAAPVAPPTQSSTEVEVLDA